MLCKIDSCILVKCDEFERIIIHYDTLLTCSLSKGNYKMSSK